MNIFLIIINFFILISSASTQIVSSSFHTLFTFIHNDPCILEDVFKIQIPNYARQYCNSLTEMNYIQSMENLDYSAFIHIERMVDEGCSFSHNTCSPYCYIYDQKSCDFFDRIKYYLDFDTEIKKIGEVLVKDPSIDSLEAIVHFINSEPHAKIILDKSFNYYGIAHYHDIFNINFLESDSMKKNNNLETISIFYQEKEYILTTQEICDSSKTLLYNNSNMKIYS
jgi:hypothetical protein